MVLNRYQNILKTSIKGSDFIFDCVHLLYYKYHTTNQDDGGFCLDKKQKSKNKSYQQIR